MTSLACILQRTFEFKANENTKMKEDVRVNVKENYVIYHVINDVTEASVIHDFNRVSIQRETKNCSTILPVSFLYKHTFRPTSIMPTTLRSLVRPATVRIYTKSQ